MTNPVVALDIDDVLTETAAHILDYYNKNFGTKLEKHHYYTKDITALGVPDYSVAAERFTTYLNSKAYIARQPLAEAVKSINRLQNSFDLIAITSRPKSLVDATKRWIKEHFGDAIPEVIFTNFIAAVDGVGGGVPLTKVEACKKINAKYMVEDHLYHALPVAQSGIQVFLLDQPWNQTLVLNQFITRVNNWTEIEERLAPNGKSEAKIS